MNTPQFGRSVASTIRRLMPAALVLFLVACSSEGEQGQQGMPPMPVTIATVEAQDVTQYGDYAARVRGAREVEIRARVSGILEQRRYSEGERVERGETLFQIEPEPYEIALKSARADLADARTAQSQAQKEWQRVSGLYERNAVSERERDQAETNRDAADANLARARAALDTAERNLRYTRVEAPVTGTTGMEAVSEGNLIEPGTRLTHMTQLDPVHAHFALPESDARAQRLARRAQADRGDSKHYSAWIKPADGTDYEHTGKVNFTDSRVDPRTGSVSARAEFPNPDGALVPGQFVRVRLALNEFNKVFLIDQGAVSEGRDGPQVFTLSDDDKAQARPVRLGPVVDGKQVILEGLSSGDRLVINGQVALRHGAPTAVSNSSDGEH